MSGAPRTQILGVTFAATTEADVNDTVAGALARGVGGWICPVNVDVLRQVVRDPSLGALVATADLVVADGMPLVWASRLQGEPLPERVAGSSLIFTLPERLASEGRSVFLLGGNPGTASGTAVVLRERYPDLRIAGHACPPFGFEQDEQQMDDLRRQLAEAAPDVVFAGLGFPKQDRLIAELRDDLPQSWFVSCGISFSFAVGEVKRAPALVQRLGLEWVDRLRQEPRRLAQRYLVHGLPFVARLFAQALRTRLTRGGG